ncbi:hypothetical protein ABPG72_015906 [Tetrahymena utriculariae]
MPQIDKSGCNILMNQIFSILIFSLNLTNKQVKIINNQNLKIFLKINKTLITKLNFFQQTNNDPKQKSRYRMFSLLLKQQTISNNKYSQRIHLSQNIIQIV